MLAVEDGGDLTLMFHVGSHNVLRIAIEVLTQGSSARSPSDVDRLCPRVGPPSHVDRLCPRFGLLSHVDRLRQGCQLGHHLMSAACAPGLSHRPPPSTQAAPGQRGRPVGLGPTFFSCWGEATQPEPTCFTWQFACGAARRSFST